MSGVEGWETTPNFGMVLKFPDTILNVSNVLTKVAEQ
jgi:hypothetical protein